MKKAPVTGNFPMATTKTDTAGRIGSTVAVVEVCIVTLLTTLAYKALKTIEPPGFNCSPGLAMLCAATTMMLLHRSDFASYGIVSDRWRYGVKVGVAFALIQLVGGLVEVAVFPIGSHTPLTVPIRQAFGVACLRIPLYLLLALLITRTAWKSAIDRVPATSCFFVLIGLLIAAPALAIYHGAPAWQAIGLTASLQLFTGLGEEFFFRGYVQSRLNIAWGRPWHLFGVSIGPGLLLSSILFGLIHVFNPTRPFDGHWEMSWLWGATGFLSGMLYGYLREATGSIWAGTIVHGLDGVYRGLAQVFLFR